MERSTVLLAQAMGREIDRAVHGFGDLERRGRRRRFRTTCAGPRSQTVDIADGPQGPPFLRSAVDVLPLR
jgi:hypothetical protein